MEAFLKTHLERYSPFVRREIVAMDTFKLFLLLFAKSVDLKIRQLWSTSAECLACWAKWHTGSPKELVCKHTRAEMVDLYFTQAMDSQEYFFITTIYSIAEMEGFPVPDEAQVDEFIGYCRGCLRFAVRDLIDSEYAVIRNEWLEYFI